MPLGEVEEVVADEFLEHRAFIFGPGEVMGFGAGVGHEGNEFVNGP